ASLSLTEEKTLPEKKTVEPAKPHNKKEPLIAQQNTEQEKLEQEKPDQERITKEAKAAEERQQAENHKKSEKEKQEVKAVLTNLVNQVVLNAELELKSQETIARRKEKKALKKLARQKRQETKALNE